MSDRDSKSECFCWKSIYRSIPRYINHGPRIRRNVGNEEEVVYGVEIKGTVTECCSISPSFVVHMDPQLARLDPRPKVQDDPSLFCSTG